MSDGSNAANMSLAPGMLDTIIALAATEVKGVAAVEAPAPGGLREILFSKEAPRAIEVTMGDGGRAQVELHLKARYGFALPDVAAEVRSAVADALQVQAGVETDRVDVYVDSLAFAA